jgi:hypothetical protein
MRGGGPLSSTALLWDTIWELFCQLKFAQRLVSAPMMAEHSEMVRYRERKQP